MGSETTNQSCVITWYSHHLTSWKQVEMYVCLSQKEIRPCHCPVSITKKWNYDNYEKSLKKKNKRQERQTERELEPEKDMAPFVLLGRWQHLINGWSVKEPSLTENAWPLSVFGTNCVSHSFLSTNRLWKRTYDSFKMDFQLMHNN